jgi:hypothetical protein
VTVVDSTGNLHTLDHATLILNDFGDPLWLLSTSLLITAQMILKRIHREIFDLKREDMGGITLGHRAITSQLARVNYRSQWLTLRRRSSLGGDYIAVGLPVRSIMPT